MAEKRQLEFFLLRYVPDAVRGEFINFGVLAVEKGTEGAVLADVRFAKDWRRVRCMDPQADVEVLEALIREIRAEVGQVTDRALLLKRMEDSFSNSIQLSEPLPVLADLPAVEIETLASLYVYESKAGGSSRALTGRQRIVQVMQQAWEQAGVAEFMHPVPAAPYTKTGDPFQFDFGYNTGREIKLFHAVSLKANVEGAVTLAARYRRIAPAMTRMTETTPSLTAVTDDDLDRGQEAVQFALAMMEEENIRVAVAAEMPMIAEQARRDLKA